MNKWEIYELLKGNSKYNLNDLEKTEKAEIIQGIEEYVYSKNKVNVRQLI